MASERQNAGLLIAAHGERGGGANNGGVVQLAAKLAARRVAGEICCGFIKSTPTIGAAVNALSFSELIVYPLFLSDGYFTRTVLTRLLREAVRKQEGRSIRILPALGLDSGLAELIAVKAASIAVAYGFQPRQTTLVLLAHGSARNSASRFATERLARHARNRGPFRNVRTAFLDESPSLADVAKEIRGPVVIVGLFTGNGLHGADNVTDVMTALRRDNAVFAGNIVSFPELVDLVVAGVERYWRSKITGSAPTEVGYPATCEFLSQL